MVSMGGFAGEDMSRRRGALVRNVFTFGSAHRDHATGDSLGGRYVVIEGESAEHCRATMLNHFGTAWAFQYASESAAGCKRYNLTEYPRESWPVPGDRFYVDSDGALCDRAFETDGHRSDAESAVAPSSGPEGTDVPAGTGSAGSGPLSGPRE